MHCKDAINTARNVIPEWLCSSDGSSVSLKPRRSPVRIWVEPRCLLDNIAVNLTSLITSGKLINIGNDIRCWNGRQSPRKNGIFTLRMSKGMGSTPIRISPMNEIAQGDSPGILRGVELWAGSIKECASRKDGSRSDTGDCGKVSSKGKIP